MSWTVSLPGAEQFSKKLIGGRKPLVPGSFVAWESFVFLIVFIFKETTCPGQFRCLGQNLFQKIVFFLKN